MKTLHAIGVKGGASPGAIMEDSYGDKYVVKLGTPPSQGPYIITSEYDLEMLIANMSRKSCEEKMFFNIAEAISDNKYQLPITDLVFLKPSEYKDIPGVENGINPRSISDSLRHKIKLTLDQSSSIQEVLERISDSKIVHFTSKLISNYQDLGDYYNYHENGAISSDHKKNPQDIIPEEPKGIGAFFALSCCLGNNDCIGAQGRNSGFDLETHKLIIVDIGNSNLNSNMISFMIPSSDSNSNWLSYLDDLSEGAQREACESFIKFASLSEEDLRKLVTTEEKTTDVLGEEYIAKKIIQLKTQQVKVAEVFYDEMMRHGCVIPEIITEMKRAIELEKQRLDDLAMGGAVRSPPRLENISPNIGNKRVSPSLLLSKAKRTSIQLNFDDLEIPGNITDGLRGVSGFSKAELPARIKIRKKPLTVDTF